MSTNELSPALNKAYQLFQAGDKMAAEELLVHAVRNAESDQGPGSIAFARANYEYASMLVLLGRRQQAADAFEVAISVNIPDDHQATRDRLTYMMQLGELYTQLAQFEAAEKVLRKGLTLRAGFYGENHPGYAFGLEPLAELLWRQGRLDEANQMVEQTIDNFWMNGHPRVATAFPLRAIILKQQKKSDHSFSGVAELSNEIFREMIDRAVGLASEADPVVAQTMLDELLSTAEAKLGSNDEKVIELRTALVNVARGIGPSEGQVETAEKVVESHLARNDKPSAIVAMLGLAILHDNLGDVKACEKTYKRAYALAKEINDLSLQSQCLRNYGLFCSERDRKEDAEKLLRLAAQTGKQSSDKIMHGRSLAALGIFLQHNERLPEAEKYLTRAIELLPASEPDSLCSRSHLQAIQQNRSCGCGSMDHAICEAMRVHLLEVIPQGFVNNVDVSLGEDGLDLHLDVARELSDDEAETLNRVVQQALVDFKSKMKEKR
ncbi:MAG: tetratricopeptide repeat protein [Pirellulales bacterium]